MLVGAALAVDAFAVEPFAVEARLDSVRAPVRAPLRVAHLSDLHTHGYGRREARVVAMLEEAKPDAIVVTGDVVDEGDLEPARAFFGRIHAPLGVFVVRGNWEHWRPVANEHDFYASVGARFLLNEGTALREDVWLAGLEDPPSGHADLRAALEKSPAGSARIVLVHSPEIFDGIASRVDLVFAGHTHGGQVRAPWGPIWRPEGSGRFEDGWYENGSAKMLVSRGIGTSVLPVRFLCHPEVRFVSIVPR